MIQINFKNKEFLSALFITLFFANLITQLLLLGDDFILDKFLSAALVSILFIPIISTCFYFYRKMDFVIYQLFLCVFSAILTGIFMMTFVFFTLGIVHNGFNTDVWILFKLGLMGGLFFIPLWIIAGGVIFLIIQGIKKLQLCKVSKKEK